MKILKEDRSRTWYLVKEWTTESGLTARIHQCVWNRELMPDLSLHDHYTGYVKLPEGVTMLEENELEVHGGVTFNDTFERISDDVDGQWVGFDMAHVYDENIPEAFEYCKKECESLAKQIKALEV